MVQPPCIAALQELQDASDPARQLSLLRLLKNDIVGHGQRKELVIRHGLLVPLAQIMMSASKPHGKGKSSVAASGTASGTASSPMLGRCTPAMLLEDEIRLQATLIISTLANGMPGFVRHMCASDMLTPLLRALSPDTTHPRLLTASLRALCGLASPSWSHMVNSASGSCSDSASALVSQVLSRSTMQCFLAILKQKPATQEVQEQIAMVADLLATFCTLDGPRCTIVKAGLLDALAGLLESYAMSGDYSHPPHGRSTVVFKPRSSTLSVFRAISAIITQSHYRAHRFIYSQPMRRLFIPSTSAGNGSVPDFRAGHVPPDVLPVEKLLPKILAPYQKPIPFTSQAFPALSALTTSKLFLESSVGYTHNNASPLCTWLMFVARQQRSPMCRIAVLKLLARVNDALNADAGDVRPEAMAETKERERQIELIAVPMAVKLVQEVATGAFNDQVLDQAELTFVQEEACDVLAELISDNVDLQRAAAAGGVVRHIAQILRKTFDPITLSKPMWNPRPKPGAQKVEPSLANTLDDQPWLSSELTHVMKCRAGALEAMAAVACKDDSIRKEIIDNNVMMHVIDSLAPFPDPLPVTAAQMKEGNTVPVVIAACHAARGISRSVANLRTSLVDARLGKPVFTLLTHPDRAVQMAATEVTINLVIEFSAMRIDLVELGVLQVLCDHAKRSDAKMRSQSLWALKHLMLNASLDFKHSCIEEIGTGWLIQAVNGGENLDSTSSSFGLSTSNAAGEQVDLLNAASSPEMDVDYTPKDDAPEDIEDASSDGEVMYDHHGTPYQSSGIRSTLKGPEYRTRLRYFREKEQNPVLKARQHDVEIQEQALDLVRNLVNGNDNVVMLDHLNNIIGPVRIFDMIYNKLKPAPSTSTLTLGFTPHHHHRTTHPPNSQLWQPTPLINAAINMMTHIAGGSSRHRQQLIAQKPLLIAWLPHFSHPDAKIRVACLWTVINLTWVENQADREDARRRAFELRALGVEDKVRALGGDVEMDVRERVKTAVRQMDDLLEGGAGRLR